MAMHRRTSAYTVSACFVAGTVHNQQLSPTWRRNKQEGEVALVPVEVQTVPDSSKSEMPVSSCQAAEFVTIEERGRSAWSGDESSERTTQGDNDSAF